MHPAADFALARRLERAEAQANAEFVAARGSVVPDSHAQWMEMAGATAMFDGVDSPCTQTFGLGMHGAVTGEQLDVIEQFFHERGANPAHEICPLADSTVAELLWERRYRPIEYSNVMYQWIDAEALATPGDPTLHVRQATADEASLWAMTAAEGWKDVAPEFEDFLLGLAVFMPFRPQSHCLLAEIGGRPIATAAVSFCERVALMAGASTVPEFRNRGAQQALLAARLRLGAEQGCDLAMVVAQPGSASQRNSERRGFRVAYTRTKWILERVSGLE